MKSFLEYRSTLTEASYLDPSELKKDASGGPNKGRARTEILAAKIKNSEPLTLKTGEEFLVTDIKSALASIEQFKRDGKSFKLIGKNKEISSSQIKKTEDFGGGSGAGGGTINTAYREAAQCVWTQAVLEKGSAKTHEDISVNDLTKAFNSKYISLNINKTPLEDILNIGDDWNKSSFIIAKYMIKDLMLTKGKVTFHHDDSYMKKIYSLKNIAFKNSGLNPMTDDKWNPGDIWINANFNLDSLDTSSIEAFNNSILEAYTNKNLIGVSLKQVKRGKAIKKAILNVDRSLTPKFEFIEAAASTSRGTWHSSKQAGIAYRRVGSEERSTAQIRTNSAMGTHKVEIDEKTARGGGANWGEIRNTFKKIYDISFPGNKSKVGESLVTIANKIAAGDIAEIEKFTQLLKDSGENVELKEVQKTLKKKNVVWIHSKYGALLIVANLNKSDQKKADQCITRLINYAGSQSPESSAHIKYYE